MSSITEQDWKYLRTIQPEMLGTLCGLINQRAKAILEAGGMSEHERYLKLYRYLGKADRVIGECFDDWRRSNLWLTVRVLYHHGLLTDDHLSHLTDGARRLVEDVEPVKLEAILEKVEQEDRRNRSPLRGSR